MNGSGIFAPFVSLVILVLGGAVALGSMLVEKKPFESTQDAVNAYATATAHALDARSKQSQIEAIETPRAAQVRWSQTQTAVPAQATISHQIVLVQSVQTAQASNARSTETMQAAFAQATVVASQNLATQTAIQGSIAMAQANATQTAIAGAAQKRSLEVQAKQVEVAAQQTQSAFYAQATATHVALGVVRDNEDYNNGRTLAMILGVVLILIAIALAARIVLLLTAIHEKVRAAGSVSTAINPATSPAVAMTDKRTGETSSRQAPIVTFPTHIQRERLEKKKAA